MIIIVLWVLQKRIGYIYLFWYILIYLCMYVPVCIHLCIANNNNAKIKLITRFSAYECVCVCVYVGYDQGDNFADSATVSRDWKVSSKDLLLRRDGGKGKRKNYGVWEVCQSRRVRTGRKFKIQGRIWRCIPGRTIDRLVGGKIYRKDVGGILILIFLAQISFFSWRWVWGEINCSVCIRVNNNWDVSFSVSRAWPISCVLLCVCSARPSIKFFSC